MNDTPLISTRDKPGEYDAFETAKPGEPIFTLQGGDPFAPPTIIHWAHLARTAGMAEENEDKATALLLKAGAAEAVAWAMQAYQRGHKPVDEPRASYQPRQPDPATEQAVILARGADRLYNFEAELLGIADQLAALGGHTKAVGRIREAASTAKSAARLFEPRRHLQGDRADG